MIDLKKLIEANVHFGHLTRGWFPKMKEYIWGVKDQIHLIDVSKTARQLEKAAKFLEQTAAEGKQILWVGTKKPAQDIIASIAKELNNPYCNHRWVGGTISNFGQVKKSVTKLLHIEDVLEKASKYPQYTKQEFNEMQKQAERLKTSVGGIRKLTWPVGAVVIVDINKERSALKEAVTMGIPVVAMVDTNADPSLVDYVIPANDDSAKSIKLVIEYLAQAVKAGQERMKEKGVQVVEDAAALEAMTTELAPGHDLLEETDEGARRAGEGKVRRQRRPARRPNHTGE